MHLHRGPCYGCTFASDASLLCSIHRQCWVSEMSSDVAALLFNLWKIPNAVTADRMRSELVDRMRIDRAALSIAFALMPIISHDVECVGRNQVAYRKHFHLTRATPGCTDECYNPTGGLVYATPFSIQSSYLSRHSGTDIEPRCYNNDPQYCPIDPKCNEVASTICLRKWVHL